MRLSGILLLAACLIVAPALAACDRSPVTQQPVPPPAQATPVPAASDDGDAPLDTGIVCPSTMTPLKCESLGGHYAPARPG
jgi:hypothetical protein